MGCYLSVMTDRNDSAVGAQETKAVATAALTRAWWRRALARLPQVRMLHQRREPLRLVSRKSQAHDSEAQTRSDGRSDDVSRSAADRTIGQSGAPRSRGASAQPQTNRPGVPLRNST